MDFKFTRLEIPDIILVEHERFKDERGFFVESFREENFLKNGIPRFVQDNHSSSPKDILRGLHYQIEPAGVGKLVRCLKGKIFDVGVDIRKGSPTYGKWVGAELSDENNLMLYVPPGFAHGFCTISDQADVYYKMTGYYSPPHDRTMAWNDPDIGIVWPVKEPQLSDKDKNAPLLKDADNNFVYNKE